MLRYLPDLRGRLTRYSCASFSQAHCAPYAPPTHSCASLNAQLAGQRVRLAGNILPERKATKHFSFFPLRDPSGTVQLIVDTPSDLSIIPVHSSLIIEGTVQSRPPTARRSGPAGDIDIHLHNYLLLNPATKDLPFNPNNPRNIPNEELRLRYRYLDLRRPELSLNLKKRSDVARIIRNLLNDLDFVEVETPVLLRSSPEGAREFLVPSRTSPPSFYALQQSPQQPKQLLVSSGAVSRYFQFAKCFRDEDGRKDRQPEFTQLDMEMAYISWGHERDQDTWRVGGGQIRDVVESLISRIWSAIEGVELSLPFPVLTYHEAMTRFGSDKPDTRFGLEITSLFSEGPDTIEALVIRKSESPQFLAVSALCEAEAEQITLTQDNTSRWLSTCQTVQVPEDSPLNADINAKLNLTPGDVIWLARRPCVPHGGSTTLGRIRLRLLELALARGDYPLSDTPHFLWVTEFPLFSKDKDKEFLAKGRWSSTHHPFTAPMWQDIDAMYAGRIDSVRGQHYDLVLNGVEIGGGSVRVHDADMQQYIFKNILQLTDAESEPFTQLLHALQCGAPPHGGIALGFDRLMSILCKTSSIRDVIAFPKTSLGTDPLFRSPSAVSDEVLQEYGIQARA